MSCCVLSCVNNGNTGPPPENISFYKIPKEYHLRQLWTEAIGTPEWQLRPNSVVCSAHFQPHDFTVSETGEKLLAEGAVPHLCLNSQKDLQAVADFRTCRVCLSTDRRMYHIRDHNLHHAFQMVVGVMVVAGDRLPQMLCWECTSRLNSLKTFKDKAQTAQSLLLDKLAAKNVLTVGDIKSINRISHNLNSHLTLKFSKPNEFDLNAMEQNQVEEAQEIKTERNQGLIVEVNRTWVIGNTIKSEPTSLVESIELKVDNDLKDEVICSSDGDCYSDSEMKTTQSKKRVKKELTITNRKRVKKDVAVTSRKRSTKVVKEKKNKKSATTRSYKEKIDLPTFDVRPLSLEEHLAAQKARAQSATYLAAPHKCEMCYRGFRSERTFAMHALRHTEKCGKFECGVCKCRFQLPRHVRRHVAAHHADQYSCKACSLVTLSRTEAVQHQKWHDGSTYTCPHCPTTLTKLTSYMSHLRIKHSSRFACELCGYTFVSKRGVEVHKVKRHKLEDAQMKLSGPYCEECKLRFASDDAYQRHLTQSSVHSNDNDPNRIRNDWRCEKQPGAVRRPRKRRAPGVVAHTDRPKKNIPCEQCGELLDSYRSYAQHFRVAHPGLNRTKFSHVAGSSMCEQCGKMFSCKALLLDHMMSHTDERRFKCENCDKAFKTRNSLAVHQRLHSAELPTYPCPYCERQFHFSQNCARHVMTVHKGEKQFQCELCGKEFTSAAGQRAHVDHVHHKKPRPKRVRARGPPTAYRE